jgi:hypothetical protein
MHTVLTPFGGVDPFTVVLGQAAPDATRLASLQRVRAPGMEDQTSGADGRGLRRCVCGGPGPRSDPLVQDPPSQAHLGGVRQPDLDAVAAERLLAERPLSQRQTVS